MILEKNSSPTNQEAPPLPSKGESSQAGVTMTVPDELPPPYVGREAPEAGPSRPTGLISHTSHLAPVAQQEINHFVLDSKHSPISGTYILNTELPATELTPRRRGCNGPLDSKNRKFFGRSALQPNAAVHTRHGSIALNLATAGSTDMLSKAHVQVSSRHGKAHVNLYSLQQNKHICLEVSTRHGNIVVFVPPNFAGAFQIRTRRGNIRFLPEFERWARLVKASDNGALVVFGQDMAQSSVDMNNVANDSCLLSTRHGKIIVGVSGVDHYDEHQEPGLLEKLGSLSMMLLGRDVTAGVATRLAEIKLRAAELKL